MSWVKLDDAFPTHPKVLVVSIPARWAYVVGLCYAAQYLTDGFVPAGVVKLPLGRELVKSGLWTQDGAGWWIHDYLVFNPSKKESEELLNKRRAAGKASARARVEQSDEQRVEQSDEQRVLRGTGTGRGLEVEVQPLIPTRAREGAEFEAFWAAFGRAGSKAEARKAWDKAIVKADPEAIIAAAQRYSDWLANHPDPPNHKYGQGWLNGEHWNNILAAYPSANGSNPREGRGAALMREAAAELEAR